MNSVLLHAGDTMDPDDVKVRKSPDYWVDPDTITEKGEPTFVKVDKPGGCSSLSCLPIFLYVAQGGQYKAGCLQASCQTYIPNEDDAVILTNGGWNFFYRGWKKGGDEDVVRENISEEDPPPCFDVRDKLFPRSRQ